MKTFIQTIVTMILTSGFISSSHACGLLCQDKPQAAQIETSPLAVLAQEAVSEDPARASIAIAALRAKGPMGLQTLLDVHANFIRIHVNLLLPATSPSPSLSRRGSSIADVSNALSGPADAQWIRLKEALDTVAQQRDCYASGLYWHTDFEQAKTAARASGKPILSLRLLGNLTDEYSCANSRFFRTALYANAEVSKYLRAHFVLHWKSVRPVPRITIDFGDGRKLERTITGNSIHYILDSEGRPIDALPGLYGPKAFLDGLAQAAVIAKEYHTKPETEREKFLATYHQARLQEIAANWESDLVEVGVNLMVNIPTPGNKTNGLITASEKKSSPTAAEAAVVAPSKMDMEMPMVRAIHSSTFPLLTREGLGEVGEKAQGPGRPTVVPLAKGDSKTIPKMLSTAMNDAIWAKIAQLHAEDSRLDASTKSLMRAKNPTAFDASRIALSKMMVEDPLLKAVRTFEHSIAEDTVRNEYLLHSRIHEWFVNGMTSVNVDVLNEKVYAELFLTPSSDPWLGLAPRDAYTALENEGMGLTAH